MLEAEPGAEVPRTQPRRLGGDPVRAVGRRRASPIGSEKIPFGADEALHIPDGQPHAAKFTGPDKTVMLQIFAPAGPEERYRAPSGGRRQAKPKGRT